MAKNIVICCDGTGNEITGHLSNVLKLFRVAKKDDGQRVYYDPGVGTISQSDAWSRFRSNAKGVFGLVTGWGLDANILDAYRFLMETYEDGDAVYLFGFSRGAYTVRVLAGFLHLVGLMPREQANLAGYALVAYKQAAARDDFEIAWQFQRVAATRRVPIAFLGLWDTVSSVIVPRPDRFYVPSLQMLPYTRTNPSVMAVRHAMAIDERRRMFRLNAWTDGQMFQGNPFDRADDRPQDVRQVWFSGVHSDIGGGYAEEESGPAKHALRWMLDEARARGLRLKTQAFNRLVMGNNLAGAKHTYVPPDVTTGLHDSMNDAWRVLEWLPKADKWKEWPARRSIAGFYLPRSEPRPLPENPLVHHSVVERMDADPGYRPPNLPQTYRVEGP
jgi:uncharacterized protein (DUF2235 family)